MNCGLIVVVVMAGMLLLQLAEVQADPCAKEANGCSVPFNFYTPFKKRFTPSCNRHDTCYSCGSVYGIDRSRCDSAFLRNMMESCKTTSFLLQPFCRMQVLNYFPAVRVGGGSHYRGYDNYCYEFWVHTCLPGSW